MSKTTIAIADAQYLIRVGLRHLIEQFEQFKIVGEAGCEKDLIKILENHAPNVVILDYQQPNNFDISSIEKIKTISPESKILVISGDNEKENIFNVVQNGVSSFLTKSCDEEEIINAIKATAKQEKFFCNKILNFILEKSFAKPEDCSPIPLSTREIEIVRLVVDGKIAKEIASQLNLSTHTIYTHRKNIMNKLELKSTSELVLYALEKGIVKSPV
ncbi:MAG: DNA-binding NarL/FixJ family response regulator [Granulosicoccus sp.]|jgi:DNA-binding NarL/FixJ family response regulator